MSSENQWYKQRLRLGLTIHWACIVIYFAILFFRLQDLDPKLTVVFWSLGLALISAAIIKELLIRQRKEIVERFYWVFSLLDTLIISMAYYQSYPSNFVVFPFYLLIILKSTVEIIPGEMRNTTFLCLAGLTINQYLLWSRHMESVDRTTFEGFVNLIAPLIYLSIVVFFALVAGKVRGIRQEMTDRLNKALKEKEDHLTELVAAHVTLEEKYVESYTLNLVQESIFQQLDRVRILENASDILMGVLGGEACAIYMNCPKEDTLRLVVSVGSLNEECFKTLYSIEDNALIPTTWRRERVSDEMIMLPEKRDSLAKSGIASVLCVPLTGQDHMWGVILLTHALKDAFPQERRSLVLLIARQLGLALDNAQLHQAMKELATHDPLTGLYNRHFLNNYLNEIDEHLKAGQLDGLSCVVMDIDNFKQINDTYGHLYGDLILQQVTDIIRRFTGQEIAARYGGEEFIIMVNEEEEKANELAEQLRIEAEKSSFGSKQKGYISVTLSCGVASIPKHAQNSTELLTMADAALYEAKRNGRNRTEIFGSVWKPQEKKAVSGNEAV